MEPDASLIQRWRAGDAEAAGALVRRHYPRMLNLFYRLTGTRDEAEELTQELFVRLTRAVCVDGLSIENLSAWLYRTGLNFWRDRVRREISARTKGIYYSGGDDELLRVAAPGGVEQAVEKHWLRDAVKRAVLELDPKHREVLVLCHYQGLSPGEAAEVLGVPAGTVRSRTHYAVAQLRRRLGPTAEGGTEPWLDSESTN